MIKNYIANSTSQYIDLQGQQRITNKIFLKVNIFKKYLALPFLCFITCFIILAIMRKFIKVKILFIYEECSHIEATHLLIIGNHQHLEVTNIFQNESEKFFYYKKVKFILNQKQFYVAHQNIQNSQFFYNKKFIETGLKKTQIQKLLKRYGNNEHIVEIPTLWEYLFNQLTSLVTIVQYIMSIFLVLQGHKMIVATNLPLLVIIFSANYFIFRNSLIRIKQLAQKNIQVQVIRDSVHMLINSRQLVPGDIFVPSDEITCDALLIKGQVYVNQASLTGQSIPIAKFHIKNNEIKESSRIYEGSKILQSRLNPLAIVMHTGFITFKGRMLRNILFKNAQIPEFINYLAIFLMQLLIICFLVYFCTIKFMIDRQFSSQIYIFRTFDIFYFTFPVFYQAFINFCYTASLYRLRMNNIFCTDSTKTIESGKIKIMCFDKTGTITKNQMKIYSIINIDQNKQMQQVFISTGLQNYKDLKMKLFATCHTVKKIEDKFYGDQLDICMYSYSGYGQITTEDDNIISIFRNKEIDLQVLKVNQFQSKFQSMSVIVRDKMENKYYMFVKGAPEKLYNLSIHKKQGFNDLIKDLSFKGLRSLAFGFTQLQDLDKYINMERQQLQKNIELLGVITFQNEIKADAIQTIQILQQADINVKMITGDNIYIAIQTAMRCKMIKQQQILVLQGCDQKKGDIKYYGRLVSKQKGTYTQDISIRIDQYLDQQLPIAIDNDFLSLSPINQNVKIFARISPESKAIIISQQKKNISQKWEAKDTWSKLTGSTKQKVGMVGDQANDVMAIKQADIGIGINQTESSLSAIFSINNLIDIQYLIREGKSCICILVQIFRFNALCNLGRFLIIMILQVDYSFPDEKQFHILAYPQVFALTLCLLCSTCSKKLQKRIPNDNLLNLEYNLAYIFKISSFVILGLIIVYLTFSNPQYIYGQRNPNGFTLQTQINTTLFLSTQLYYSFNLILVYRSDPWKNSFWKNYLLLVYFILLVIYNVIQILFIPINDTSKKLLGLIPIPDAMRYQLFGITVLFILMGYIIQQVIRKIKDKELI